MISLRLRTKVSCIAMSPLANYGAQGGLYRLTYWLFYPTILITLKRKKLQDDNLLAFHQMDLHPWPKRQGERSPAALNCRCVWSVCVNHGEQWTNIAGENLFGDLQGLSSPKEPLLPLCFRTWISWGTLSTASKFTIPSFYVSYPTFNSGYLTGVFTKLLWIYRLFKKVN